MKHVAVAIKVGGLNESEARAGLPDLAAEFQQRPWLQNPAATWQHNSLNITLEYPGADAGRCAQAALDEIRDCVVACFQFSGDLQFDVQHPPSLRGTPHA